MQCQCKQSNKPYKKCCEPFHIGEKKAEDAKRLMQTRYSAYALNIPHYIINTTHPEHKDCTQDQKEWIQSITQFSKSTTFQNLRILHFTTTEHSASVTFFADLKQNNKDVSFTELSTFEKCDHLWLYKSGQLINPV